MRFPLFLGTDAGGYNIELKRGFVETPERLSLFAEARLYRSAQSH